jgi:hypothetical protein
MSSLVDLFLVGESQLIGTVCNVIHLPFFFFFFFLFYILIGYFEDYVAQPRAWVSDADTYLGVVAPLVPEA